MKKNKLTALLLCAAMAITSLAGCGNKENTESTKQESKQTQSKEAEATSETQKEDELEDVTLKVWMVGPGKQQDSEEVWDAFNELLKSYLPHTTVEFEALTFNEYATRWPNAIASEESIDLSWAGYMVNVDEQIKLGAYYPLTELLETYCQDAVEMFGGWDLLNQYKTDGELYLFPCWQSNVSNSNLMSFQTDTLDLMEDGWVQDLEKYMLDTSRSSDPKVKEEVLKKLGDYFEACKQAGMLRGGADGTVQGYMAVQEYWLNGLGSVYASVDIGDNTFTVHPYYTDELYKLLWQYKAEWYTKGYIRQDIASVANYQAFIPNDPENSTVDYGGGGGWTEDEGAVFTEKFGFDITTIYGSDICTVKKSTATDWCIPVTAKNPERAAMLMNLLNSEGGKELYQLLVYGIEGKHYTKNTDGTITMAEGAGATSDSTYGTYNWLVGNIKNSLFTDSTQQEGIKLTSDMEEKAIKVPVIDFKFDGSELEAEMMNLAAIWGEYSDILEKGYAGDKFEEKYQEMVKRMDDAGAKEFFAEVQRQLDEYVKANGCTW